MVDESRASFPWEVVVVLPVLHSSLAAFPTSLCEQGLPHQHRQFCRELFGGAWISEMCYKFP